MVAEKLREYELVMVLTPQASDEEVAAAVDRVAEFVTQRGGEVTERQVWGVRRLAYPINRFQEGSYTLTRFTLDPGSVLELDRNLNISEEVLRHLVMRA